MKKGAQCLGKALLYLLLFLAIHTLVYMAFSVAITFYVLMEAQNPQLMLESEEFLVLYSDLLTKNTTLLALTANALVLLVLWIGFAVRRKPLCQSIGMHRLDVKTVAACALFALGLSGFVGMAVELLPFPADLRNSFIREHDYMRAGNPIVDFCAVVILAPFAEEIIFRGLIYTRLKEGLPTVAALLISSAVFGWVHGEAIWAVAGFLGALALVWVFENTGSLAACIIVHMVNNLAAQLTADWYLSTWQLILLAVVYGVSFICGGLWLMKLGKKPEAPRPLSSEA